DVAGAVRGHRPGPCRGDPGRPPGGARVPLRRSGVHSAGVVVGTVVRRGSGTVGRRPVGGTRYAFHGFRTAAPVTLGGTDRTPPGRCRTHLGGGPRRGGRTQGGWGGPRRGVRHRHRPGYPRPRGYASVPGRRGGVAGHAGVFTTAIDLGTFARETLRTYVTEGGAVPRSFVRSSWQPHVEAGSGVARGLGWLVTPEGVVYHNGFTGTSLFMHPES